MNIRLYDGWNEYDRLKERVKELEKALAHAQEAIFWYGAEGFKLDEGGKTIGSVIEEVL